MSDIAGVAKAAAGAKVLTGTRSERKPLLRTNRTMVVALAMLALAAFGALIVASQAPNAKHYSSVGSKDSQPRAAAPVSEPAAAPQISEKEAMDAYGKLPLAFVPNEGQTDKAVRYYAQGAGYGFFSPMRGLCSPSLMAKGVVATRLP